MESEEEKPIVHVDHRLYHDEPKVVLDVYDLEDIPEKVKHSIHQIRGFDGVLQEFRRPPSKWLNHWAKLDYGEPVPVLFDAGGHPYIMAPAKHQETAPLLNAIVAGLKGTKPIVKALIHEKGFDETLARLKIAKDFCDSCSGPLDKEPNDGLMYASGGGTIADIYTCALCEVESIRWDKDFLEEHPILQDIANAATMELKTR